MCFLQSDLDEMGRHKHKGDERAPEIRCRLVAKEVKKRNNTEEEGANIFASQVCDFGSNDPESISKQASIEDELH